MSEFPFFAKRKPYAVVTLDTCINHNNGLPKLCLRLLGIAIGGLVFSFSLYTASLETEAKLLHSFKYISLPLPDASKTELSSDSLKDHPSSDLWHTAVVRPGDNLSRIFSRLDLGTKDLYTLISSCSEAKSLNQLHPGQIFKIRIDTNGNLQELIHEENSVQQLRLVRQEGTFTPGISMQALEKRISFAEGVVKHSLYRSALKEGLSDALIGQFVEIFTWDIDMALDIQPGDSFTVIYEEYYRKGEKVDEGPILAAEFTNRGKIYRAVRYTDRMGNTHYYTPNGRSMRQTFLRSPLDFRRISSRFQSERWHPVLGVKRPHRGVDYAAPVGTPVWASGDGIVKFIGKQSGYGNVIILQHGEHYTTLYGHLSRFHKGLRKGSQVKQGHIIGYVGKTGLATGPHLHYEFRIEGKHIDPIHAKLPRSLPMNSKQMADFRKKTSGLIAQLDIHRRTRLALLTKR